MIGDPWGQKGGDERARQPPALARPRDHGQHLTPCVPQVSRGPLTAELLPDIGSGDTGRLTLFKAKGPRDKDSESAQHWFGCIFWLNHHGVR